ncbi:hypothetical protein MJO29_010498 [Puccinia striiformis f. sp. tritici]|uniref:hypothetical protein n=1 Tax=Puccinia striiformis f. sp. tritici TaxID=168172 RepID=UPI00200894A7|nr:hypothetical protein Pst134EA_019571 [Puccinia striiformis f. sp. tritici]KAH9459418.1 hypothetical protein Pst134EA_019571 [Puccinia striiformis f. sp. tritici]KAI7948833.1 hypothetical protein MJO29_010498 [Puccinia striiformis f. sp. tritici]
MDGRWIDETRAIMMAKNWKQKRRFFKGPPGVPQNPEVYGDELGFCQQLVLQHELSVFSILIRNLNEVGVT